MKSAQTAEIHILERVMYLLEEGSVRHVASQDDSFQHYVANLYDSLETRAQQLRTTPQLV